jgi:outer membrane protein assembly factor BamB
MELFGYVCSPLCKAKASSHGIEVPVFAGQATVVEARRWRKMAWAAGSAGTVLAVLAGFWFWYAWFGSEPSTAFSVRFSEPAYSGQSWFAGKDQLVFLHGDILARHDLKLKKEIWSRRMVDMKDIEAYVDQEIKSLRARIDRANSDDPDNAPKMLDPEKLKRQLKRSAEAALELRVKGQNIWVASSGKLVRYDWETGKPVKEIPVQGGFGSMISRGDEMLLLANDGDKQTITSINLDTCESRIEEIGGHKGLWSANHPPGMAGRAEESAGLPIGMPGRDAGRAMDPGKVAEQAAGLSKPAQIALPALLANSRNQERILKELNDQPGHQAPPAATPHNRAGNESVTLIPTKDGFIQISTRILEPHFTSRSAMKARPAKSALDGAVNMSKTTEVANEILNDMQRDRGGDVVQEDESRYQVQVRQPNTPDVWRGEVIGPPRLFPLQTVNVVAGNKSIVVLDKGNKKLWESSLNFNVVGGLEALEAGSTPYGQGPCVEHNGILFVFDQGVLTAFDLVTGNPKWRYPSVGIAGLFFDDQGMLYVNTTTASLDKIRYSRQIDISSKDVSVLAKIDPKSGKVLWTAEPGGLLNYCSGKFLYTMASTPPDTDDEEDPYTPETGLEPKKFVRIKRLDPKNGKVLWEHFQQRSPIDVQFEKNSIRLVFKKEVQVLKFVAF